MRTATRYAGWCRRCGATTLAFCQKPEHYDPAPTVINDLQEVADGNISVQQHRGERLLCHRPRAHIVWQNDALLVVPRHMEIVTRHENNKASSPIRLLSAG